MTAQYVTHLAADDVPQRIAYRTKVANRRSVELRIAQALAEVQQFHVRPNIVGEQLGQYARIALSVFSHHRPPSYAAAWERNYSGADAALQYEPARSFMPQQIVFRVRSLRPPKLVYQALHDQLAVPHSLSDWTQSAVRSPRSAPR